MQSFIMMANGDSEVRLQCAAHRHVCSDFKWANHATIAPRELSIGQGRIKWFLFFPSSYRRVAGPLFSFPSPNRTHEPRRYDGPHFHLAHHVNPYEYMVACLCKSFEFRITICKDWCLFTLRDPHYPFKCTICLSSLVFRWAGLAIENGKANAMIKLFFFLFFSFLHFSILCQKNSQTGYCFVDM